jgi:hypothetical protein
VSGAQRNKYLLKKARRDAETVPINSRRSLCLGPSSPTYEFPVDKITFVLCTAPGACHIFRGFVLAATSSLCKSYYLYSLQLQGTNIVILLLGEGGGGGRRRWPRATRDAIKGVLDVLEVGRPDRAVILLTADPALHHLHRRMSSSRRQQTVCSASSRDSGCGHAAIQCTNLRQSTSHATAA